MNASPSSIGLPIVVLREIGEADAPLLDVLCSPEVSGEWDSFDDPPEAMLSGAHYGGGSKIVELTDGTPVGSISWIQIPYGPNAMSLAWSIGITILPQYRGQHLAASAQRLLAEGLLGRSEANRVQADTDIGNVPEQRALERAGFTREGIARGAQWRRGEWHDRVVYGLVRGDLPTRGSL
ncbi:MAG: GNAT family N-acetyltransferase [Acidimicrobiales bacterium]